jgi:hypothetical protein
LACPPACPAPACSEDETEIEKAAAAWGKKNRPKKKQGGKAAEFQAKQNVRKNKGRKR